MELLDNTYFWIALSFILFVFLAYKLGRKTVVSQLDAEIAEIRRKIDTAENLRVEAQEMLAQYQRKQRDAIQESERIIENARNHAAQMSQQAEKEIDDMIARREQMLSQRLLRVQENAIQDIHDSAADLAVRAAEVVIKQQMKDKHHKALVDESIENIASLGEQSR